ncbi:maleylpyruvate isomerase family mycothiol-dependent enzyme [Nocardia sp. NBC_01503]|uniref:maleylpyruvate isomerase family mycothiol-dependent enzyme n=1 Tax=Nocardia sp. NBC_01503 TaxID=2975997 RepID=UPI002E7C0A5A|nr:maleylpyruvate isomerase family mycothiol-dependent enzyme [Nocardia sp. NBC_01503]WTL32421.1 maleylpyruvate isomerase family mycothiol-dependent enzyme [Nocardia sp. NBC_01503]
MNVRQLLRDERGELVELLRSLSDQEWETPSLCAGWRVRDVVGHLQTDSVGLPSYLLMGLRAGSVNGTNTAVVEHFSTLPNAELVDRLEKANGWFSRYMPKTALADTFVHQQDIRRPLGRERKIPAERLIAVLEHPDPFASPGRYLKGLRWEATDADWSRGSGPLVRGPGEALALAMVGRTVALDDLDGDGVPELRVRCG